MHLRTAWKNPANACRLVLGLMHAAPMLLEPTDALGTRISKSPQLIMVAKESCALQSGGQALQRKAFLDRPASPQALKPSSEQRRLYHLNSGRLVFAVTEASCHLSSSCKGTSLEKEQEVVGTTGGAVFAELCRNYEGQMSCISHLAPIPSPFMHAGPEPRETSTNHSTFRQQRCNATPQGVADSQCVRPFVMLLHGLKPSSQLLGSRQSAT